MTKAEVLRALAGLANDELEEIVQRANYLRSLSHRKPKAQSTQVVSSSPLVSVITLYAKRYTTVPSDYLLQRSDSVIEQLNISAKEIERIAERLHLDRKETICLCNIVLEAAHIKAMSSGRPFSFRTLLFMIKDPCSLLEDSYPGYFSTDLFKIMVIDAAPK